MNFSINIKFTSTKIFNLIKVTQPETYYLDTVRHNAAHDVMIHDDAMNMCTVYKKINK